MYTIKINIKNPKIISQDYRNHVKCETIGDFKDNVRKKYKNNIENYVYDIILHSTEIDYQIPLVESVIKKYTLSYEEIEINKNNFNNMLENIKYLDSLKKCNLPKSEYVIINSAWLAMMSIRTNGDLDVMISSKLWETNFSEFSTNLGFGLQFFL